jgi:hypothetical protein
MYKSLFYLSIFILCHLYSCKSKNDSLIDNLTIDESKFNSDTTKYTSEKEDYSDINFPSSQLVIGQKLSINYQTYGCFNFSDDTITITREKDWYSVLHRKRSKSNDTYSTASEKFDSSYSAVLKTFCVTCKKIKKNQAKKTLDDRRIYTMGTIKRLIMNDGLHHLELFIENDNMFYNLLNPLPLF